MLKSIRIQNFKSYKDSTLELSPFTVLIGANASGKSNAIEALRFLSILANGQKLSSFKYTVLNKDGGIRGGIDKLMFRHSNSCEFECSFDSEDSQILNIGLGIEDDELHIQSEKLSQKKRHIPLYEIKHQSKSDITISYDNFAKGKQKKRPHLL